MNPSTSWRQAAEAGDQLIAFLEGLLATVDTTGHFPSKPVTEQFDQWANLTDSLPVEDSRHQPDVWLPMWRSRVNAVNDLVAFIEGARSTQPHCSRLVTLMQSAVAEFRNRQAEAGAL